MKKAARLVFAAVLAVVVAACGSRSPAPEPTGSTSSPASSPALSDTPPSILLVTLDTTRADAMGFESGAQTTPALDALAARGVRFAHAYATAPVTLPSHASMLTGLYPYEHGVRENSRYLAADHERLAERLTGAGYRTASVVSGFPLAGQFGLARGFEHYDDDFGIGAVERPADATTDRALERIRSTGSAPLFLWVHYYDPHEPYAPPEPFASEHPGDPYLGEIAFMDSEVGRLVDGFETRFRATGTRILVAGDHGEARGDHGEELHGNLLYQGVMRVPLIVVGDGTGDGNGGAIEPGSRSEPVSVRRVFDTVLEWSGTPRSHDLLEGPSEVVLGEAMKPFLQYGWQPQVMAVLGVTKAIRSGELEIYDLSTDPGESHNLVRDTRLEPKLGRALAAYPVLQKTAEPESSDTEPSRTDRERLAALGYVGWQGAPALQDNAPSPKDMTHLFAALDRGSAQFVRREYAEAITTFEKVLKQDPRNLMVSVRLAVA
ncbi:MAG: sulfatase, partial [Acidobacteriota bacterium]|nr:sulfatase [Acidobacteriota bacterium]